MRVHSHLQIVSFLTPSKPVLGGSEVAHRYSLVETFQFYPIRLVLTEAFCKVKQLFVSYHTGFKILE